MFSLFLHHIDIAFTFLVQKNTDGLATVIEDRLVAKCSNKSIIKSTYQGSRFIEIVEMRYKKLHLKLRDFNSWQQGKIEFIMVETRLPGSLSLVILQKHLK